MATAAGREGEVSTPTKYGTDIIMKTTGRHILLAAALVGLLAVSGLTTQTFAPEICFDKLA